MFLSGVHIEPERRQQLQVGKGEEGERVNVTLPSSRMVAAAQGLSLSCGEGPLCCTEVA